MRLQHSILILSLSIALSGCQPIFDNFPVQATEKPAIPAESQEQTATNITFFVETPTAMADDQELMIEFLDELTGLAIAPVKYPMERIDATHFKITREVTARSIIKYRYFRNGDNPSIEHNSLRQQVRYRFVFSSRLPEVRDQIGGWNDLIPVDADGIVEGKIIDGETGKPAAGILLACGGDQVVSSADGTFRFDRLRPGTHTLSALSMDGMYLPFQQEAVVAANSRTPADFAMSPGRMTNVIFSLNPGSWQAEDNTIRIIGDLSQGGNTFNNQGGEQSVLAVLAPAMQVQADGAFQAVLRLPIGQVFSYKYTLGDGLWNSERETNGGLFTRKVLISEENQFIQDELKSFALADGSTVSFTLETPENTPAEDQISIQFNPFDWSPPLPMQKIGENRYQYILYGPQDLLGEVSYRYCRNDRCENNPFTTDGLTASPAGVFRSQPGQQQIAEKITAWADWQPLDQPTIVLSTEPVRRAHGFISGYEMTPDFKPFSKATISNGWNAVVMSGANSIFLTPTWRISTVDPLVLRQTTGRDASIGEIDELFTGASQRGLIPSLFPQILASVEKSPTEDLSAINPNQWAEALLRFYSHFALIAQQNSAEYLIVDGSYLDWRNEAGVVEILINVRQLFSGKVLLAAPAAELPGYPKELLGQFDGIYLLLECTQFADVSPGIDNYSIAISNLLDEAVYPLIADRPMPVIVGGDFPSAQGNGQCYRSTSEWTAVRDGFPHVAQAQVDLAVQSDVYNAVLSSVVTREWISGLVSRGYAMESAATDSSSSVHGKPASDVLWYWFSKMGE